MTTRVFIEDDPAGTMTQRIVDADTGKVLEEYIIPGMATDYAKDRSWEVVEEPSFFDRVRLVLNRPG